MIQFNLLPDVKIEYLKTQRTKRAVMLVSLVLAAVSITVLGILFLSVQGVQKNKLDDITKEIETENKKLTGTQDLNKILTIQNQLSSLTKLHDEKPVTSRLLGYIQQITPAAADISKLDIDFTESSITIAGTVKDNLLTVNKYADTIKFATFKSDTVEQGKPFSNVVTTLSRDNVTKSSFVITFNFDPILFSNVETPVLTVPQIVTNRSQTEKPGTLFKEAPVKTEGN